MDDELRRKRNRRRLSAGLGGLVLVWLGLSLTAHNPVEPVCVRLPNGLILAPEARIHLLRRAFQPGIVIRGPDGEELSGVGARGLQFSETTVLWFDPNRPADSDVSMARLAFRSDVGLVLRQDDGRLFRDVRDAFGVPLEEPALWYRDEAENVWAQLKDQPPYREENCAIALISWMKSEASYQH